MRPDVWDEGTAKDGHVHLLNRPYDANRPAKELEGRMQANRLLFELTNSLFGGYKKLGVYQCVDTANFHGPVIKFNFLNPYDWAGFAIMRKGMVASNSSVKEFITHVEGTYAQIIVAIGPLVGKYVISIQTVG